MKNKNLVLSVPVTESERGWGRKVDDYMVCLSLTDAKTFTTEFNSKNTEDVAPDWYMVVEHDPQPLEINDKQFKALKKNKRMWLSELEGIK